MNNDYKNWLVGIADKMPPDKRTAFVNLLKFHPDKVLEILTSYIRELAFPFAIKFQIAAIIHDPNDPQELLQAMLDHFAIDLAAIKEELV